MTHERIYEFQKGVIKRRTEFYKKSEKRTETNYDDIGLTKDSTEYDNYSCILSKYIYVYNNKGQIIRLESFRDNNKNHSISTYEITEKTRYGHDEIKLDIKSAWYRNGEYMGYTEDYYNADNKQVVYHDYDENNKHERGRLCKFNAFGLIYQIETFLKGNKNGIFLFKKNSNGHTIEEEDKSYNAKIRRKYFQYEYDYNDNWTKKYTLVDNVVISVIERFISYN